MDDRIIQFRVGVLVVATCLIMAILIVLFGEWPTLVRSQYTIFVRFDEAPGVTVDTPVRKSGILIGRVSDVALRDDGGVLVTLKIDAKRTLRENEVCRITAGNVLLGDAALEFVPSGAPGVPADPLTDGAYIDGVVSASPLEVIEVLVDVANVVRNLEEDITLAAASVQQAGGEVAVMARNINALVGNNQEQFARIMQKSEQAMDRFEGAMSAVDELVRDDELRDRLRRALEQVPELVDSAQQALSSIDSMARRAEQNLENMEGFTRPLGESGPELVQHIDQSIRRLDEVMSELVHFGRAINNRQGTVGQLVHNPDLYQQLNRAASNLEEATSRLRPVVEDARIFADKIARDPGRLSSGVLRPRQSGRKW